MAHHLIPARPESMVFGYLDARIPPVLTVNSGDTVKLEAVPAGREDRLPPECARVPPLYRAALAAHPGGFGSHFITGPVFVRGAEIGDTLQVEILSARPTINWGFVSIEPLAGTLPAVFDSAETVHPAIDVQAGTMTWPWGGTLPLDPFFGILAVAPPPRWGRCISDVPRAFGGNMDNKELRPGTMLYLPVFNEGALFMAGDGHGVQGDGEVCVTALETGLTGTFRLTVRKDYPVARPFAESETHLIAIGLHEDLDDAAAQAVAEMIDHLSRRTRLTASQAYMLCSLAGDLRVTQLVDGNKGVHMMLAKAHLPNAV
ncbi:acetamidase/formamidase family protein [Acidisoma silvae]|nr:acetamidase/formamidase family protein [Acidisoma silvae]